MRVCDAMPAKAVALLTLAALATALSGCGTSSGAIAVKPVTSTPTATAAPTADSGLPANTKLEVPKAAATITATATLTAVPGASELAAPRQAPRTIQGFPVPRGVKVKDPGAMDSTWQFDIGSTDLNGVIAFYKRVLPQMGYKVRTDVTYTLGNEPVQWDIVFDGPVSGSMVRDVRDGTVFVVVNPPGQPALPGDQ